LEGLVLALPRRVPRATLTSENEPSLPPSNVLRGNIETLDRRDMCESSGKRAVESMRAGGQLVAEGTAGRRIGELDRRNSGVRPKAAFEQRCCESNCARAAPMAARERLKERPNWRLMGGPRWCVNATRSKSPEAGAHSVGDEAVAVSNPATPTSLSSSLNPLKRAGPELKLTAGFVVRSAPKGCRVVDRIRT
jgi:hypothetical protein